ncbi:MAG: hypothetical protein IJV22_06400 [Bacteroidales bacterium]|nr:hypothetical protein [Bacteroidales bacterium]
MDLYSRLLSIYPEDKHAKERIATLKGAKPKRCPLLMEVAMDSCANVELPEQYAGEYEVQQYAYMTSDDINQTTLGMAQFPCGVYTEVHAAPNWFQR